eukprot:gene9442-12723_t
MSFPLHIQLLRYSKCGEVNNMLKAHTDSRTSHIIRKQHKKYKFYVTSTSSEESKPTNIKFDSIISLLFQSSAGKKFGDRVKYHENGTYRKWSDHQIWSHLFFVIAGVVSYTHNVYELFILLAIVTPLSVQYHRTYEKPGLIAGIEGVMAKVLFFYGCAQLFYIPNTIPRLIVIKLILFLSTVTVFLITNMFPDLYDPWHSLMHVFPALWALIVGLYHKPFLALA